jgi:hypothetical protein
VTDYFADAQLSLRRHGTARLFAMPSTRHENLDTHRHPQCGEPERRQLVTPPVVLPEFNMPACAGNHFLMSAGCA